ncbi:sodium/calcium exchanger protein [Pelomyxa schiedti]|nr:sodium/calcium exchanger protein [Pelomyxa schiedti]
MSGSGRQPVNWRLWAVSFIMLVLAVVQISSEAVPSSYYDSTRISNTSSVVSSISSTSGGLCVDADDCDDGCACARNNSLFECYNYFLIDYYVTDQCAFDGMHWLSAPLISAWALFLAYMMLSTTDQWFCESIAQISNSFGFSNYIGGVLFLAFGNGAPTTFTATVAFAHKEAQFAVNILVGAGCFLLMVVMGGIALTHRKQAISRRPFFRDIIFYVICMTSLALIAYFDYLKTWICCIVLVFFILFIAFLVTSRFIYQNYYRKKEPRSLFDTTYVTEDTCGIQGSPYDAPPLNELDFIYSFRGWGRKPSKRLSPPNLPNMYISGSLQFRGSETVFYKRFLWRLAQAISWHDKSLLGKIFYVLLAPSLFIRHCSIPPLSLDEFGSIFFIAMCCINCPLLILLCTPQYNYKIDVGIVIPVWLLLVIIGIFVAPFVCILCQMPKTKKYYGKVVAFPAFLMSGIWLYLLASEFVSSIRSVGGVVGVSDTILGLTIIVWGTCIIDLIANVIVAKNGITRMAVGATLISAIITWSVSVGVGGLISSIRTHNGGTDLCLPSNLLIAFVALGFVILVHVIVIPVFRFRLIRQYGIALIALYGVLSVLLILVEALHNDMGIPSYHCN